MFSNIAFFQILGKPLIMYGGILTFLLMLFTASIPSLQKKWPKIFSFNLHVLMARITIFLALVHGVLGLSIYLGF
jgi:cytochrome b561